MTAPGQLVLVATPIGNLGDLSPRAVDALRAADVVACEDTRRTGRLLAHAGIEGTRLVSLHEHNERQRVPGLVDRLVGGATVALVSDAGTPGVSDPGLPLVRAAAEAGVEVVTVPGPSAVVAALSVSGLATDRWVFEGFLPRKGRSRAERIAALAAEERTVVLFESPHRLASTLSELSEACGGDRAVVVARELTKLHEEVWRGSLAGAVTRAIDGPVAGEHVLVLGGAPPGPAADESTVDAALGAALASGASVRDAASEVAAALGISRRRAYERAIVVRDAPTG